MPRCRQSYSILAIQPTIQAMKNRPGERARLQMRAMQRDAVARMWRQILVLVAVWLGASVGFALAPTFLAFRAFAIGFLAAAFLGIAFWMLFVSSGSYGWHLGKLGEEATAEAVCGPSRRRQGWRLVNGLPFGGLGDVDHVLIGPGGVFAIESKYSTSPCQVSDGGVDGIYGREPIAQARRGAVKVQKMLRYGPRRFDVTVRPVVVIWGRGRVQQDGGWEMVGDVLLCDGPKFHLWLTELNGDPLDQSVVDDIECVLTAYLDQHQPAVFST